MKLEYDDAHHRKSSKGVQRQALCSQADKPLHICLQNEQRLVLK